MADVPEQRKPARLQEVEDDATRIQSKRFRDAEEERQYQVSKSVDSKVNEPVVDEDVPVEEPVVEDDLVADGPEEDVSDEVVPAKEDKPAKSADKKGTK